MNEPLKERLIGRSGRRTAIQLVVASVFVGAALGLFGITPGEFWRGVINAAQGVLSAIGENVGAVIVNLATYFFFGAAIVIPVWLVARLLSGDKPRK
jgi:hypothetical protein